MAQINCSSLTLFTANPQNMHMHTQQTLVVLASQLMAHWAQLAASVCGGINLADNASIISQHNTIRFK